MLNVIRLLSAALFVFLLGVLVYAQSQQSMFDAGELFDQVWFNVTIADFYVNIALLIAWVVYKETHPAARLLWPIAFVVLGGLATTAYVFIATFRVPAGAPAWTLLLRKDHVEGS